MQCMRTLDPILFASLSISYSVDSLKDKLEDLAESNAYNHKCLAERKRVSSFDLNFVSKIQDFRF